MSVTYEITSLQSIAWQRNDNRTISVIVTKLISNPDSFRIDCQAETKIMLGLQEDGKSRW